MLAILLVVSACSPATERGSIRVLAAASLTESFEAVARSFSEKTGIEVELSFAGTATLIAQVEAGGSADVMAAAHEASMDRLVSQGLIEGSTPFVSNRLAIAVPEGNPDGINDLGDLERSERSGAVIAVCAAAVPCGSYAASAFEAAGAELRNPTREASVKSVIARVAFGGASSGVVYETDIAAARARGLTIEGVPVGDVGPTAEYPIAVLSGSTETDGALAFVDFVQSDVAQRIFADFGFMRI